MQHEEIDTVIVPAREEGFKKVFLGEECWYSVRIPNKMLLSLKHIAAYRTSPISAVTHYATILRIEVYGEPGKYKVIFSGTPKSIVPIPFGNAPSGAMQGPRFTSLQKLLTASTIKDLVPEKRALARSISSAWRRRL